MLAPGVPCTSTVEVNVELRTVMFVARPDIAAHPDNPSSVKPLSPEAKLIFIVADTPTRPAT